MKTVLHHLLAGPLLLLSGCLIVPAAAATPSLAGMYLQAEQGENLAGALKLRNNGSFEFGRAYSYDVVQGTWAQTDAEHIVLSARKPLTAPAGSKENALHAVNIAGLFAPLRTWWAESPHVATAPSPDTPTTDKHAILVVDALISPFAGANPAGPVGETLTAHWSNGQTTTETIGEACRVVFHRPSGADWQGARITSLQPNWHLNDPEKLPMPAFDVAATSRYVRIVTVMPQLFQTLRLKVDTPAGQHPQLRYDTTAAPAFPGMDRDTPFVFQP